MALKTISGLTKITDTLRKIGGGGAEAWFAS